MATNNNKSVTDAKSKTAEETKPQESVYTAAELTNAHKIFNTSHEIVAVALKLAGKEKATVTEAKAIIEEFKNKEVK